MSITEHTAQYFETVATFYEDYANEFEPYSLRWEANMAAAEDYRRIAVRIERTDR